MNNYAIEHRPPAELRPYARNARKHSKKQLAQIAVSITRFGFTNPVLISDDAEIIAGHGRVAAAKLLGLATVPTLKLSHLSETERRAYVLADNKLALNAGWDADMLAIELQGLIDLSFDVELTGFSLAEIDLALDGANERDPASPAGPKDQIPALEPVAVTRTGDLWRLGRHRLLCGDARRPDDYQALLQGEAADLIFTDPPYNVPIDGHVCGLGRVRHREFAMGVGEMSEAQFTAFLAETLGCAAAVAADGAMAFVCMDWRHLGELLAAGRQVFAELKNLCVWNKTNAGMLLSLQARAGTSVQGRNRAAHQQLRPGRGRPLSIERLGLSGRLQPRQRSRCSAGDASDRQAHRPGGRRYPRLLQTRRDHTGSVRRLGHHAGRRRQLRADRPADRVRPALLRRHRAPLRTGHRQAGLAGGRRGQLRGRRGRAPRGGRPMSDERDDNQQEPRRAGAIGYGRPPKEHQFKPGQSGNPKGRPTRPKSALPRGELAQMVLKAGNKRIKVHEGDKISTIKVIEAILRGLTLRAVKGDHRAQLDFTKIYQLAEAESMREAVKTEQVQVMNIFALPDNGRDTPLPEKKEREEEDHDGSGGGGQG
jgi:Family of unknown function (DUF5681)/ParB-like nuclease domain